MPVLAAIAVAPAYAQTEALSVAEPAIAVLEESCFKCHRGARLKAGLNLSSRAGLLEGGDRGAVIDEADPANSLMLAMVSYKDPHHQMPPTGKLPDDQLAALTAWVMAGAPWPDELAFEPAAHDGEEEAVAPADVDHWAYDPVTRPEPPAVADAAWAANPIDAFVYAKLDEAGLKPAPPAGARELIRRVYYDLTGLPPSPDAVEAFAADPSDTAYEAVVDELLASPQYGEKWARHWLDVVRYADSNGYERDSDKLHMWRYRDYVIDAFNDDKPYDDFIREQLAGDELDNVTPETKIATGYHRLHVWDDEPADPLQSRYDNLDDVVSTTSQAFLGMTVGCARCHDHKIDPIPQKDYYRFLAFFENITPIKREQVVTPVMTAAEQAEYDARVREKQARVDAIRERLFVKEAAIYRAIAAKDPDLAGHISDLTDLSFRFYRDTWDRLPDFDMLRPEEEGPVGHNFINLARASRRDAIGMVYEGKLRVPQTAAYTFNMRAKDGVRLRLNGRIVAEADGVGDHTFNVTAPLQEGFAAFRLEYFNKAGDPVLHVTWTGPGVTNPALSKPKGEGGSPEFRDLLNANQDAIDPALRDAYHALKKEYDDAKAEHIPGKFATTVLEDGRAAPETHVLVRGNAHVEGDVVQAAFPEVLNPPEPDLQPAPEGAQSTGRRRALAEWIASPDNPLTARVMVNRIWQGHFDKGIVGTPNDFGVQGDKPTHPELLDWLAQEFMAHGWQIKPLHKQILLSRTYRQSARGSADAIAADPQNKLLARFPMRRLTAEEIRDSMLAVAGTLKLDGGGPGFFPELPEAVLATSSMADALWHTSPPEQQTRRSIYIHVKRSILHPLLQDFDLADTDNSCPVRFATTQPLQALNMLNSEYVNQQAEALADRLRNEADSRADRVRRGWALATQRPATGAEVERSLLLMNDLQEQYDATADEALDRFCLVLLNLNELMYLD